MMMEKKLYDFSEMWLLFLFLKEGTKHFHWLQVNLKGNFKCMKRNIFIVFFFNDLLFLKEKN